MANGHAKRSSQTLANEARTEAIRRLQDSHREEYDSIHDEERQKRGLDTVAAMKAREAAKSKPGRVAASIVALSEEERATLWRLLSGTPTDPEA